jgi:hypothetical protein
MWNIYTFADLDPGSCLYYHNMFSQLSYIMISLPAVCTIKLLKLPIIVRAVFLLLPGCLTELSNKNKITIKLRHWEKINNMLCTQTVV